MAGGPPDPDLRAVTGALIEAGARFVVIGGFAVIAHRHVRATEDVDVLLPGGDDNDRRCLDGLRRLEALRHDAGRAVEAPDLLGRDHLRVRSRAGLIDLVREGVAPLDFASVEAGALRADLGDGELRVAGLASVVAFKRLAGRPRDRQDLEALAAAHGELPVLAIPGLDEAPG
jgi:hypothetical protein